MRFSLLDPLRGVAALWVFAYHYDFSPAVRDGVPFLHAVFKLGHLGVPMFFVISGYCLAAAARGSVARGESRGRFLYRRFRRIYPTYWFSFAVVAAVPFVLAGLTAVKGGGYVAPSPEVRSNGFLRYDVPDWLAVGTLTRVFDTTAGDDTLQSRFNTINAVYWTLAIEVQFYVVVTLARYAGRRFHWALAAVTVGSLVACRLVPGLAESGLFPAYWPQFWFGTLVCLLLERGKILPRWLAAIGVLGLGGLFLAAVRNEWPAEGTAFAGGFAVAVWLAAAFDPWFRERMVGSGWRLVRWPAGLAVAVGAMSYSIYLLHGRLRFVSMLVLRQVLPVESVLYDAAVFVLTCAVCWGFYLVCERPFTSDGRAKKRAASESLSMA